MKQIIKVLTKEPAMYIRAAFAEDWVNLASTGAKIDDLVNEALLMLNENALFFKLENEYSVFAGFIALDPITKTALTYHLRTNNVEEFDRQAYLDGLNQLIADTFNYELFDSINLSDINDPSFQPKNNFTLNKLNFHGKNFVLLNQ